jgi:hypothetical protein
MPLSAFDWAITLLFAFLGWWAIRSLIQVYVRARADLQRAQQANEEERAQRILKQQESLESSVRDLIKVFSEFKTWVVLEFVRRPDHEKEIARLETTIADHAERFQVELKTHREESHGLRG